MTYELHIVARTEMKVIEQRRITSDDLVKLCAEFVLIVATITRKVHEFESGRFDVDDDIPF